MKHVWRAALSALALVLLTACGGSSTTHNQADVAFAQQMIPHHRQAVMMASMAASHGASSQVRDLAARISKAQGPEIRTMTGWLHDWGSSSSSTSAMPGMMSASSMSALDRARGAEFDRLFLTEMVGHHRGAVVMANQEVDAGSSPDAIALARRIVKAQTSEIAEMRRLLASG